MFSPNVSKYNSLYHNALSLTKHNSLVILKLSVGGSDMNFKVNESAENYLETIYTLSQKLPSVRSVDVANELGFKKSSVSVAMKNLREKNHIVVSEEGHLQLTTSGMKIAQMIHERHELLTSWLTRLGVPEEIASEDACKLEHVLSEESFEAIKKHAQSK